MRNILLTPQAFSEYDEWARVEPKMLRRINALITSVARGDDDLAGIGKPELLKGEWAGFRSRRINKEHRLIYRLSDTTVEIVACRRHYGDK